MLSLWIMIIDKLCGIIIVHIILLTGSRNSTAINDDLASLGPYSLESETEAKAVLDRLHYAIGHSSYYPENGYMPDRDAGCH